MILCDCRIDENVLYCVTVMEPAVKKSWAMGSFVKNVCIGEFVMQGLCEVQQSSWVPPMHILLKVASKSGRADPSGNCQVKFVSLMLSVKNPSYPAVWKLLRHGLSL